MGICCGKPSAKEDSHANSKVSPVTKPSNATNQQQHVGKVSGQPAPARKADRPKAYGPDAYELVREFQTAGQGKLKVMQNKKTKEHVLAKFVQIASNEGIPRDLEREIVNHRQLLHPNIVRFYEVLLLEDSLAIISEYPPGGVLSEVIKDNGPVTETQAKSLFLTMLAGMEYCHKKQVYHRDIRAENMYLDNLEGAPALKIAGFGYSKHAVFDGAPETRGMHNPLNTPPELLKGGCQQSAYDGSKLDVWGAGIVLFFTLTGFHPFEDEKSPGDLNQIVMKRIFSCTFQFPDDSELTPECKDFIKKIFVADPEQRPTIQQMRASPWLSGTKLVDDNVEVLAADQTEYQIEEVVRRARLRRDASREATTRSSVGGNVPVGQRPSKPVQSRYSPAERNPRAVSVEGIAEISVPRTSNF